MPDDASNARPGLDAPTAPIVPTVVNGTQADASTQSLAPDSHLSSGRPSKSHGGAIALAIGAVGVVFGDIGTSPLYAFQETIAHHGSADRAFVMGVLSLIFWALFLVVVAKYQLLIMRATNRGEGGLFALLSLLPRGLQRRAYYRLAFFGAIAIMGSALLFGDGVITPSISVLSAMEGLSIFDESLQGWVAPLTTVVLVLFFAVQRFGTGHIGRIFGPVMLLWFSVLGILGLRAIISDPSVLAAVSPHYAIQLIAANPSGTFLLLGSIVLVVTGAEALYADIGHFGIGPIRIGWFSIVWPCLILNYFGQGAWAIANPPDPSALSSYKPFYGLVPAGWVIPMVVLATFATIVASQAMISGVFSMARQAIRLNYLPRLAVVHTSSFTEGQIYIPFLNWTMMIGCLTTVFLFRSSTALADAYGIAVTAVMGITSLLFAEVAIKTWKWKPPVVWLVVGSFLAIDMAFLSSNLLKVFHGGWYALAIAAAGSIVMVTWNQGTLAIGRQIAAQGETIHEFLARLWSDVVPRVPGTAVFMTPSTQAPFALVNFVKHAHVLHEQVILLSIAPSEQPYVADRERVVVRWMPDGFWSVSAQVGFMEQPDAPAILRLARERGLPFDTEETTYFARKMQLVPGGPARMASWRKGVFIFLHANAADVTSAFNLPSDRTVEFGFQLKL
ncbi:MAG: KUP/HAK/KT family potassium transporter [Planctomycetota bacterium]